MQRLTHRSFVSMTKTALQEDLKPIFALTGYQKNDNVNNRQRSLHHSVAPMQKLLRFPAFPLEETITKFLITAQPLLTSEEFQQTKAMANEFVHSAGLQLQKLLEKTADKENNWLAERWLRTAYLQYRDPVTVYSSPGMTFPLQPVFKNNDDFINYSAKLIYGLVKYKQLIDNNEIPVAKMGKLELDNSQFQKVFGTCRIPQVKEDGIQYHPKSKHIAVVHKNHFYKLPVYNKNGLPLHPDVLSKQLLEILREETVPATAIGILTTDHRDNWAEAYAELIKMDGNSESIKIIQQSLFTLSLDDFVSRTAETELNVLSEQLIHGGGSDKNSGNRWMDKTIQVIVNPNGMSGFTYEHSPAEGQPIALMTDYVTQNLTNSKHYENAAIDNFENYQKLPLKSNARLNEFIENAKKNVDKLAADLHMHVLHYQGYGKEFCKLQKLSPDSYIQIAQQYAFYKLHKVPGGHYESAHLRIYAGGRTETIRSCSNESVAFARAMCEGNVSNENRVQLLRKAVESHRQYTNEALQGRGVDRHLLGLKLMALENNLPIPEFFKSPGVIKSSHFRISTSQVATNNAAFMCYGPLTHDGYACCYNPRKNDIFLSCAAWRSNNITDVNRFAVALQEAFDSMQSLLCDAGEKISAKL